MVGGWAGINRFLSFGGLLATLALSSCAPVDVPGSRAVNIPAPAGADERRDAINERPDSVVYLPLGSDVLQPELLGVGALPHVQVGPFELRSETLAGALQLILADYEIPMAFESEEGLTRTVTITNLRGDLSNVVQKVCSLADLYCSFEDGVLIVKDTQTFTVTIPPIAGDVDLMSALASGVGAITGGSPITESGTRTIIYEATNRTAKLAERYFQRLRANTALIVYEIYIWQVELNNDNSTGIDWESIDTFGVFDAGISIAGGAGADFTPISIGLPTKGDVAFGSDDVFEFISTYGAVKTVSQPQVTMLSGSSAQLRVLDTINYVSSLTQDVDDGIQTVSTETDSVDEGFTMTVSSAWDNATVYGNIEISLQEVQRFQPFTAGGTTIQLPETSETELNTQVRIRPGDSLLIAGLVSESDNFTRDGPGFGEPIIATSRTAEAANSELVILMRPKVIVYTSERPDLVSSVPGPRSVTHSPGLPVEAAPATDFPMGTVSPDMMDPSM